MLLFASLGILEISILLICFAVVAVLTETEKFGWATFSVLVAVAAAQWLNWVDIIGAVRHNLLVNLAYLGGFIVVGVVWSFVKWFSFLMRFRDVLRKTTVRGSKYYGHTEYRGISLKKKPQAAEQKARITAWMIFWPFSFVGTLLNDPVRRIFNLIFGSLKQQYQKLSDRLFRGVVFEEDRPRPAPVRHDNDSV